MREILFRGKRTDNGEWVEGFPFFYPNGKVLMVCAMTLDPDPDYEEHSYYCEGYEVDPETVGEYTGLEDKNGKKIFEGDIVKQTVTFNDEVTERVGKVAEDEVNPCFVLENIENPLDIEYDFIKCFLSKLEVIGNIYDNPELLKEVQL